MCLLEAFEMWALVGRAWLDETKGSCWKGYMWMEVELPWDVAYEIRQWGKCHLQLYKWNVLFQSRYTITLGSMKWNTCSLPFAGWTIYWWGSFLFAAPFAFGIHTRYWRGGVTFLLLGAYLDTAAHHMHIISFLGGRILQWDVVVRVARLGTGRCRFEFPPCHGSSLSGPRPVTISHPNLTRRIVVRMTLRGNWHCRLFWVIIGERSGV